MIRHSLATSSTPRPLAGLATSALGLAAACALLSGCSGSPAPTAAQPAAAAAAPATADPARFLTQPLVTGIYTADPSAHVFNGRVYVYGSHDIETGIPMDDLGTEFAMRDYRPLSMDSIGAPVTIHDVALDIANVPWADKQMWAPDAAEKGGKYFLYFPAKDKQGVFHVGVATGDKPEGPFKAEPEAIKGSFSIDPAVFRDDDGSYYMAFGGLWGGQLQRWKSGHYDAADDAQPADDKPALSPKIVRLDAAMTGFAEKPRDLVILDEAGKPLLSKDHDRRFFEASWLHKYKGNYYFSYSTGDTHYIVYAMGKTPYGPYTYKGKLLDPVLGWTNHHSIVEVGGKWWLFYHDSQLSNGDTHLRNIKQPVEIHYNEDGTIQEINPLLKP
jgi:hypothetical protein